MLQAYKRSSSEASASGLKLYAFDPALLICITPKIVYELRKTETQYTTHSIAQMLKFNMTENKQVNLKKSWSIQEEST